MVFFFHFKSRHHDLCALIFFVSSKVFLIVSEEEQKDESQQPKSAYSLDPGLPAGRKLETSPGWAAKSNEIHGVNTEGGRGSCCLYALYADIFGSGC